MFDTIAEQTRLAAEELLALSDLKAGDVVVIGCSSSEVTGGRIGTASNPEVADVIFETLQSVFTPRGIYIAAQCCEHLNRAIIVERAASKSAPIVNVLPQPKAGGSFATAAYRHFADPVALEFIQADAGLDIGGTLIGMHLKCVAVPLKLTVRHIGSAVVIGARTRPKFIGGSRAVYDEKLL
ncbi:MAG: TIGR01440 family protein [Clostridia bacterium]|nr:TIGR01440 family protein [Clostridia bacterium]